MSILSQWVLSICGVIILCTAVEILMPAKSLNKYIKSVLAIICMYVIILPIPNLLNGNSTIGDIFYGTQDGGIDYSFIQHINEQKVVLIEKETENYLAENGFKNAGIQIEAAYIKEQIEIIFVRVNLKNVVIKSSDKNINSNDEVRKLIVKYLNIIEEKVLFV